MKIKALLVIPGREVQTVKIPGSIKFIKSFIGKDAFQIKITNDIRIIANEKAPMVEFNRLFRGKIILGSFIVISTKNEKIISMKNKEIRKYRNVFKLRKHERKINFYREKYLENYYSLSQMEAKENSCQNNEEIAKLAA